MSIASVFNPVPNDAPEAPKVPETSKVGTEIVQLMEKTPYEQNNYYGVDNVFAGSNVDYTNHLNRNANRFQREDGTILHRDLMERNLVIDDNMINVDGLKKEQKRNNRLVNDMKNATPYSRTRINKENDTVRTNLSQKDKRTVRRHERGARINKMLPQFAKEAIWDSSHMLKGTTYAERKAELDNRFEHMFKLKEEMTGKSRDDIKKYEEYKALNKVYQRQLQGIVCGWVDEMCGSNGNCGMENDFSFGRDHVRHDVNRDVARNDVTRNNDCNGINDCNRYELNRMNGIHSLEQNFDNRFDNGLNHQNENRYGLNRLPNDFKNDDNANSTDLNWSNDRVATRKYNNQKVRGDVRLPENSFRENYPVN